MSAVRFAPPAETEVGVESLGSLLEVNFALSPCFHPDGIPKFAWHKQKGRLDLSACLLNSWQ